MKMLRSPLKAAVTPRPLAREKAISRLTREEALAGERRPGHRLDAQSPKHGVAVPATLGRVRKVRLGREYREERL